MSQPAAIQSATMSKHVRMCLYGEPGIGKSRLLGTSPGRVLILRPTVDHLDSLLPADKARVKQWLIGDWDDMQMAEDYLRAEGDQWDWVWVDSASLLQDVLLDDELDTEITESKNPKRKLYGPDQGVYGRNMYKLAAWMRHLIGPDLFNFGFTAHPANLPSPDLDEDGDPILKQMPWIQGKNMSPKLCGYTNLIAFMERDKTQRVIRTMSDERFYAKDQFDALKGSGWALKEPTMPKLLKLIETSPGRTLSAPARKAVPAGRPARRRVKTNS